MADLEQFRAETRSWLEANCPPEMRTPPKSDADVCWGGRKFQPSSPAQAENFAKSRSENAIFRGEIASKYRIFFGACGGPIIELLSNTTNYDQLL